MKEAIASNEIKSDEVLVACVIIGNETAVFAWSELAIVKLK
jgi:hypothetical protein